MHTLFPGNDAQIEINDAMIAEYYQKIDQYTKKYKEQIIAFCTDLYAYDHYKHYPSEIQADVMTTFKTERNYNMVVSQSKCDSQFNSEYFKQFIEDSHQLIIPRKLIKKQNINSQYKSLIDSIDEDKAQQTLLFQQYFTQRTASDTIYLDLGAGKGYLSSFLAFDCNQKIVSIEASEKHAISLAKRIYSLTQRNQLYSPIFQYIKDDKITIEPAQHANLKLATAFVDTTTDPDVLLHNAFTLKDFVRAQLSKSMEQEHRKHSQIQGKIGISTSQLQQFQQTTNKYTVLGLHACGDLSVTCLRLLSLPNVRSVFTVPCCYPHLTDNSFPLFQPTHQIINNLKTDSNLTTVKLGLPKQLLNYACTGFDEPVENARETVFKFHQRAILEKCRLRNKQTVEKRAFKPGSGREWIQKCVQEEGESISMNEIKQIEEKCEEFKWAMNAHLIFRQISGQVLESMILVDRLLWMRAQKYNAQIDWCMGGQSGRGFVLWATKE
ncbi:Methyltransferase_domain-containing protein [Hexamita inflata]|uniref:Methyltransferase domain-containing protein n=1 Tax=Hexamita inflata TaxID=28002 RepID=A0AA86UWZ2_9EUKA|nr:Methyltransferase domain-containing protein [Hexamita inflata]